MLNGHTSHLRKYSCWCYPRFYLGITVVANLCQWFSRISIVKSKGFCRLHFLIFCSAWSEINDDLKRLKHERINIKWVSILIPWSKYKKNKRNKKKIFTEKKQILSSWYYFQKQPSNKNALIKNTSECFLIISLILINTPKEYLIKIVNLLVF